MKIVTDAHQLTDCLEIVEKALPIRSTIPVIANILFETKENKLIFSATNLEMYIKVTMNYPCEENGKILLPPKIVEIMRYFPTTDVSINIDWDNYCIDISGGSAHFRLYGSSPEDYPLSFESCFEESPGFSIEQSVLKNVLKSIIFAASNEETRPAFNGILFSFCDNKMSLTASDTYRLALKDLVREDWKFDQGRALVPAKAMRELLRILGDGKNSIAVFRENNMIAFQIGQVFFASRLLEEKYPDISGVIPEEYRTRTLVDRKMLEEAVSRAALLAEGKNQAINILAGNQYLEARVTAPEGSMEEKVAVEQQGEDIELHINSRFLLDVLKIIDQEKIVIDFNGESGPMVFRLFDDDSYIYLVLPIKKVN